MVLMKSSLRSRSTILRRVLAAAAALGLVAGASACGAARPVSGDKDGKLAVSVSFYPIQYLVESIGGDHVKVTSVTPANVEPHDFELSPKDVTSLSDATLIAYVAGFQPSLDDAVKEVSGPTVVDLSSSVDLVHHEGAGHDHDHGAEDAHDHESGDAHDHDHESGEAHDHDHEAEEDAGATDPHFWLDPQRMSAAAKAITAALTEADPDHKADYEANLKTLTTGLDDLDASFTTGLSQCERTTFVTSHAAFGYLADRYHLTQTSISGIDPESEPSPADLAAIQEVVTATGTTTIFTEELVSPETAQAVADQTGATTAVLSPVESAPEKGDYAAAMKANLEALRTALGCQ